MLEIISNFYITEVNYNQRQYFDLTVTSPLPDISQPNRSEATRKKYENNFLNQRSPRPLRVFARSNHSFAILLVGTTHDLK